MFLSFVSGSWGAEHEGKKADMCGDQWKDQDLVMFFTYTAVFTVSLASKK